MHDGTAIRERETIYIRKFANAAARARNDASEVVQLVQTTVDGLPDAPIIETVTRTDPNFPLIDAAARAAEAQARKGA